MRHSLLQRMGAAWFWPLYRRLETAAHPLRYLFLEVTQRCNLACLHCGSDCGRDPAREELTTAEWLALLDYLAARYPRDQMLLAVTGGEPLCAPEFDALLESLGKHRFRWGMVSNGWALTTKRMTRLLRSGLRSLTISLDGLQASHDWLRGVEGSYDRAVAALRHAVTAPGLVLDVVTCVTPRSLEELPALRQVLLELGVRDWRLFPISPIGRAKQSADLLLPGEQLAALLRWIATERQRAVPGTLRPGFCCEGHLPLGLDQQVRDQPYFCRAGITVGSVLCDGSIGACPNTPRSLVQGNLRCDDLASVWDDRFAPFRHRQWMRTGPCTQCREWGRCLGNSLHLWDEDAKETTRCHLALLGR